MFRVFVHCTACKQMSSSVCDPVLRSSNTLSCSQHNQHHTCHIEINKHQGSKLHQAAALFVQSSALVTPSDRENIEGGG